MNTKCLDLGKRRIGPGEPCFLVAEAGVNHNGNVDLAKQLIDAAQTAGADAVKFQTWITDRLVAVGAPLAEYQRENLDREISQYEMLKQLELTRDQFTQLREYSHSRGILFLSTPDEEESADFLDALGVPLFKIGSGEVTNLPFLGHVARKGKPLVLSTGMSSLAEVEAAVETVESAGLRELCLLHCVSQYPARKEDCNLRAMDTLALAFGCPVGFSDHTLGIEVALAAVARGACLVEKHLTLDKALPGPDHRASLDPQEFAAMVRGIRAVESALGDGRKRPTPEELETRKVVQKVLVLRHSVHAGDVIEESDLLLLRAEGGLPATCLPLVVGRIAACNLPARTVLNWQVLR